MTAPTYLTNTARNLSTSLNDLNLSLNSTTKRRWDYCEYTFTQLFIHPFTYPFIQSFNKPYSFIHECFSWLLISCNRLHTVTPNLSQALRSSDRIQRRVDELVRRRDYSYLDSDVESDYSLDLLRDSLRDERNALNDAIKEADRE